MYQEATLVVVPSILYESFSYTCAQAMAAGLPVVASRHAGIPETVEDGVSGILTSPGNPLELAGAILQLLEDGELRKKMGSNSQRRASKYFDTAIVALQTVKFYEKILSRTRT